MQTPPLLTITPSLICFNAASTASRSTAIDSTTQSTPVACTLVVAVSRNGLIGLTGPDGRPRLPWVIKSDLKHFKAITSPASGAAVIMGRRTFESLAGEGAPLGLPGRLNIVVSRTVTAGGGGLPPGVLSARSANEAIAIAHSPPHGTRSEPVAAKTPAVFLIGGAELYGDALARGLIDRIEITDVQAEIAPPAEHRATFFPLNAPGTVRAIWAHDPAARAALGWSLTAERETPRNTGAGDEHACIYRTYIRR